MSPIQDAERDATITCSSDSDSTFSTGSCISGYYINDMGTADVCTQCSTTITCTGPDVVVGCSGTEDYSCEPCPMNQYNNSGVCQTTTDQNCHASNALERDKVRSHRNRHLNNDTPTSTGTNQCISCKALWNKYMDATISLKKMKLVLLKPMNLVLLRAFILVAEIFWIDILKFKVMKVEIL